MESFLIMETDVSGEKVTLLPGTYKQALIFASFTAITLMNKLLYFNRNACAGCGEELVVLVSKLKCSYKM